jgi:predicted transglutaminase-like cysteine proteinase
MVAASTLCAASAPAHAASQRALFVSVQTTAKAPIGWIDFCHQQARDCAVPATEARDVVLSTKAWKDLVRANKWVNDTIKPITDQDHWGVVEKWSYPDDGKGDCEDYVLLKRRMLVEAGWPRQALLITVVRDKRGDGHAVLTVKTDKGEFVLDNQAEDVLLWSETGYRFVKRQSQEDPNVWVSLGDPRPTSATASAR